MLIRPQYLQSIRELLTHFPVVSVLGPRQVGKTTLARSIAAERPSHFFDLEDTDALARLAEPKFALERLEGLIVLDEVQRRPDLFPLVRVLADRKPIPARFWLVSLLDATKLITRFGGASQTGGLLGGLRPRTGIRHHR